MSKAHMDTVYFHRPPGARIVPVLRYCLRMRRRRSDSHSQEQVSWRPHATE